MGGCSYVALVETDGEAATFLALCCHCVGGWRFGFVVERKSSRWFSDFARISKFVDHVLR